MVHLDNKTIGTHENKTRKQLQNNNLFKTCRLFFDKYLNLDLLLLEKLRAVFIRSRKGDRVGIEKMVRCTIYEESSYTKSRFR